MWRTNFGKCGIIVRISRYLLMLSVSEFMCFAAGNQQRNDSGNGDSD